MESQEALLTPLLQLVNSATNVLKSELRAAHLPEPWLSSAKYHPWDEETPSRNYWEARRELISALSMMMALVQNPRERLAADAWGHHQSSALHIAAKGKIADILSSEDVDPTCGLHVDEIAIRSGMSSPKLCRVMRYLSVHHVFEERAPFVFANNRLSIGLKSTDTAHGNIMFFSGYSYRPAPLLSSNLTDPATAHSHDPTESAFAAYWNEAAMGNVTDRASTPSTPLTGSFSLESAPEGLSLNVEFETDVGVSHAHEGMAKSNTDSPPPSETAVKMPLLPGPKSKLTLFDFMCLPTNAEHRANFARSMVTLETMNGRKGFLDFEWGRFDIRGAVFVEVGAGTGHLSLSVLPVLEHAIFVNQDLPEVCKEGQKFFASENPMAISNGKVTFQPNDFFTGQPINGAPLYILCNIVHDWPDALALKILEYIVQAMAPSSRLLVIEIIIEPALTQHAVRRSPEVETQNTKGGNPAAPWPLLANYGAVNRYAAGQSLELIHLLNALDRTLPEYVALFEEAGLELVKVHSIRKLVSIMELQKRMST